MALGMINRTTMTLFQLVGISALLLVMNCKSHGQTPKVDQVKVAQNFQVGKKYEFEVQRGKADSRQPGTENIKSSTEVEFVALSTEDNLKECSWKYGSTSIVGINPDQIDERTRKYMDTFEGMEVKFLIDKNGLIHGLTNFEDCKNHIKNSFRVIYDNAVQKLTSDEITKMMDALKPSYDNPEALISTYCPEITVFFTMFGETIKSDSVRISHSELPNPFGGRNFPTDVSTKIEEIENNIAVISVSQTIPEKDLNEIMRETVVELSKLSNKPFDASDIPKVNMSTTSTFKFDYQRNVLLEVYTQKIVETSGIKQTQTLKVLLRN